MRGQLQQLLQGRKLQCKKLEATLGLLMWATSTCVRIRPCLASLYRDLRSAAGTLKLIHPQFWQPLLDCLDDSAKVTAHPPGLWLPIKARVTFAGNAKITCNQDLPKVTPAQKGVWISVADLTADQARSNWPQLSGSPQQYIACFETLAQLALAMTARHALGAKAWQFALPAASDNTAAEARTEKLWSTAEPLGTFLKPAAGWQRGAA